MARRPPPPPPAALRHRGWTIDADGMLKRPPAEVSIDAWFGSIHRRCSIGAAERWFRKVAADDARGIKPRRRWPSRRWRWDMSRRGEFLWTLDEARGLLGCFAAMLVLGLFVALALARIRHHG